MLAGPVVFRRRIGLRVARGDLVEGVERPDPLAGREILGHDRAVRQRGDPVGQPLRRHAHAREVPGPGGDDDHLLARLRDGRRGQRNRGGAAQRRAREKPTTFHGVLPWSRCGPGLSPGPLSAAGLAERPGRHNAAGV